MSSASPSHVLVSHQYATDGHLPSCGEIIVVCLSEDLFGPGSEIQSSRNLPSRATRHNYHHAVVLCIGLSLDLVSFTVLPISAYSFADPVSGLSSTSWLLRQADDFQQLHIPVPYEEDPTLTQPHPPFPIPVRFGDPLEIGGWKSRRPSWVHAVPQVTRLKRTTTARILFCLGADVTLTCPAQFKCFEPPVKLSKDELGRLEEYCRHTVISSSSLPSVRPGAAGGPNGSPAGDGTVPGSRSPPYWPGWNKNHDGVGLPAGTGLALQALYANDAVKRAFADFDRPSVTLDLDSDDDDDDDDDNWEDNMDPITFARYHCGFQSAPCEDC